MRLYFFLSILCVGFVSDIHAAITVDGDLSQTIIIEPGNTQEGIIMLRNLSNASAEVRVYQTDYSFSSNGQTDYSNPGENPRSNAGWLFIQPTRLTISPLSRSPVYYTVKVPDNQELSGTFWSVVMIEEIPPGSKESNRQQTDKRVGLSAIMRYGVQIITEIGDTGTTSLKFLDKKLVINDVGNKSFQIDIENNGEKWYMPDLWIELYDSNGNNVGRIEAPKKRIFPGCSVRHLMDISSLKAGKYKMIVIADTGNENVFGAEYDLELEE